MALPVPSSVPACVPDAWRREPFASPFYLRSVNRNLFAVSREGLLSLYGGKLTTYRAQCERLGVRARSTTRKPRSWFLRELREESPGLFESDAGLWES